MKMQYKLLLVLMLVGVVFVSGCVQQEAFLREEFPSFIYQDYIKFEECMSNLKNNSLYKDPDDSAGLIIFFFEDVGILQINELADFYGFKERRINKESNRLSVDIPLEHQYYWICKLMEEKKELIKEIHLNRRLSIN